MGKKKEFKVGDMVRRTAYEFHGMKVGDIGEVVSLKDGMGYQPIIKGYGDKARFSHATENLELVNKPCSFKVGDRVKGGYDDGFNVTTKYKYTGTITSIDAKNSIVWVDRDGHGPWRCLIRPDGNVAGAHGMDDGKTNLELFNDYNDILSKVGPCGTMSRSYLSINPFSDNRIFIGNTGDTESVGHIKNKKTNMIKKLSNFIKKMVDADTQALIEADYMFSDLGGLTTEGKEELLNILFIANKAALVEAAKAKIDEAKAKKD